MVLLFNIEIGFCCKEAHLATETGLSSPAGSKRKGSIAYSRAERKALPISIAATIEFYGTSCSSSNAQHKNLIEKIKLNWKNKK